MWAASDPSLIFKTDTLFSAEWCFDAYNKIQLIQKNRFLANIK